MIKARDIVRSPAFGCGVVLLVDGSHVSVYFPDLAGTAQDATKKLLITKANLSPAPDVRDPRLDNVLIKVANGKIVFPKGPRRSQEEAVKDFLIRHPLGFVDPLLRREELDYKRDASSLYDRLLGAGRGHTLLEKGALTEVASHIDALFQATNIPSLFERLAVRDGVKSVDTAGAMLAGVLAFVDAPDASTFGNLVEAVDRLPAKADKARVLTWPIVTLLPFLADPARFIVVKPEMTKVAAERLFFDIGYDSHPNWSTYERILTFARYLRDSLEPEGAKDFIDVHSFIWVTAGEPMMTPMKGSSRRGSR